jgi:serine/threonine protein kinase/beta-lactam-binding protein with PASTA domain
MSGRILDGRYRVGPRIARGGMATVYQAHDLRLERGCAVKIMHTDLGDDHDFAARFVREAHSAARLSHPNVVAVTDQGDDDGVLFLVMEHVPGETLRDVIRQEAPMEPARALALLEPVLQALAEAHRCGLVHRDVKPENVLIADDGRVKVADFGLARAFDANTSSTATGGVLIGTVSYLAPELIVDGKADPRSDVYAAGVLLYEMLTGRKPHEGESAIQIAYKHVNEDVPPPSSVRAPGAADLPAFVDALVVRATARERERRQADAKVFLQQVRRVRAALRSGETEDPELTADLLPTVPIAVDEGIDYVEDSGPAVHARHTTPDDVHDGDHELTTMLDGRRVAAAAGFAAAGATALAGGVSAGGVGAGAVLPAAAAPTAARLDRRAPADPSPPRLLPPSGAGHPPGGLPRQPAGPPPTRRRRRRRGPALLVVAVLLVALTAYAGWWLGIGRYTSAPGIENLPVKAAQARLSAAGLDLEVAERTYSETVAAGSVISTDPQGGERVVEGGTVDVVVSLGPERYEVPTLRGKDVSEVGTILEDHHLALAPLKYVWSEVVPRGKVVAATPRAGTELKPDAPVTVAVSKGPRPIKIPDLTGRNADRAESRLSGLGFEVDRTEENSDTVDKGKVISQDPDQGKGHKDDTITLVVSKGPVMVEVPSLKAMTVTDATQTLSGLGLDIEVRHSDLYIGLDRVAQQDPGSGDVVPKGSTVIVYVV